jgi:hypothetical protein
MILESEGKVDINKKLMNKYNMLLEDYRQETITSISEFSGNEVRDIEILDKRINRLRKSFKKLVDEQQKKIDNLDNEIIEMRAGENI